MLKNSYKSIVAVCAGVGMLLVALITAAMSGSYIQKAAASPEAACSGYSAWCTSDSVDTGTSTGLSGVAVVSSTNVWAVGSFASTHIRTLAEHWNGTAWSVVPSGNLSSIDNKLTSVAAAFRGDTITNVLAVGFYYADGAPNETHALAERWNGTQWVTVNCPEPANTVRSILYKVYAVPNSNDFWAVGQYDTGTGSYNPLIEHWHNGAWSVVNLSLPNSSALIGVSAFDVNNAWAVGYTDTSGGRALILHYDGNSWSSMTPATVNHYSALYSVDVFTPNDIWAVGSYGDTSLIDHTLTEHYNGQSWTLVPAPDPGSINVLNEVWVTAAGDVWVAGTFNQFSAGGKGTSSNSIAHSTPPLSRLTLGKSVVHPSGGSYRGLVFHWNGNDWDSIPIPHQGTDEELLGVSASLTSTWAVGYYDTHTLVERMVAPAQAPKYVNSHYESSVDTKTHYKQGCNAAHQNTEGGIAVLDYGQPRKIQRGPALLYGAKLFISGTSVDTGQIAGAVEAYMDGYHAAYIVTGNCGYIGNSPVPITIALGTSNFNQDLAAELSINHAQAWASMVGTVKYYAQSHGYSEITVAAAMDVEPNFSKPYTPTPIPPNFDYNYSKVATWVSSYTSNGVSPLYNYGSTDGFPCRPAGTPVPVDYPCSVWNADQLYNISWGIPGAKPLPEAYYAQFNRNWYVVKRYGELVYPAATPMTFAGSMTDCLPGNICYVNPADPNRVPELCINEGWGSLWNEINSDPFYTQPLTWSTYITNTNN